MRKILLVFCGSCLAYAAASDNGPPQVYQPTYVYGSTPMGVYMGNPYDLGTDMVGGDMFMPNGEPMTEMQTQSGEQEQEFQYLQGQEELMKGHSQEALKAYQQEQVIGESMEQKYIQQIDQKTHQAPPPAIVLPQM